MNPAPQGKRFGRLVVVNNNPDYRLCRCDCGRLKSIRVDHLTSKRIRSCGCLNSELSSKRRKTHGGSKHPLFRIWCGILSRCYNEDNTAYDNYGGRGITVCDLWKHDFWAFVTWANKTRWAKGLELDRTDNNLGYSPENCRFVTHKENNNNKRTNHYVTAFGETKTLKQWSEDSRCKSLYFTVLSRVRSGWSAEDAIATAGQRK